MKQKTLRRLLPHWQERLRLQDWDIELTFVPQVEIEGKQGDVEWKASKRRAWVRLLKPGSWRHGRHPDFDHSQETDLVHELVHLKLVGVDDTKPGTVREDLLEQAVHDLSRALVDAYRR